MDPDQNQTKNDDQNINSPHENDLKDKFNTPPLNQVISDPSSFGNIIKWQCAKCKFTYEGTQTLEKCPKCGADKEFFMDV